MDWTKFITCIHQTLEKLVNIMRQYTNFKVTILWLVICLVWRGFLYIY